MPRPSSRYIVGAALAVQFLAAGLISSATASPALAEGVKLYAYATAVNGKLGLCPKTAAVSKRCTLSEALSLALPGSTVLLATPGAAAAYVGNWTLKTPGTSSTKPVIIAPAPGVSKPVLDGNHGSLTGCRTKACNGPVLTIGSGVYARLQGLTVRNGYNSSPAYGDGGAIFNDAGTVSISGSTFSGNRAHDGGGGIENYHGVVSVATSTFSGNLALGGGAIENYLAGTGSLVVTASTFSGNGTQRGGPIDSTSDGDGGAIKNTSYGNSVVNVSTSTFSGNEAGNNGGAIDNADDAVDGTVTVSACTFSGNSAGIDGGAIDNADLSGLGAVSIFDSTFTGNTAGRDGNAVDNAGEGTIDNPSSGALTLVGSTFSANGHSGVTVEDYDVVWAAADIFDSSCGWAGGTWHDEGYNVGGTGTCLNGGTGDVGHVGNLAGLLGALASNGGPTQTMPPLAGNPAVGIIPGNTTATLGKLKVLLCPTKDQRGVLSAAGKACNAGAVQDAA